MRSDLEVQAAAQSAQFESTRLAFDLIKENSHVLDALIACTPQVAAAAAFLRERIPLPRNAVPGIEGRFYRLPSHNRSFCYSLADSASGSPNSPVLVFKGTEPLLQDFSKMLDWMAQAPLRKSSRVMADHFPLAEGKIPGTLSLKEALSEARTALHVQERHLRHYGELAKLPTPLLVHAFSDSSKDACTSMLRANLSRQAFERIESLLGNGLAIYVYYYPSAPIRSNYQSDMGAPQFRPLFANRMDEEQIVRGWVRLLVRLLYLGYLPYSVRNEGLGACMDFGNATIDGGFCDPDSIVEIDASTDAEFFREGVIQSLVILQNTLQRFLGLSDSDALYPSTEAFVCRRYMLRLIDEAIESERRPGLHLDPRFLQLMEPRSLAEVRSCSKRRNRLQTYVSFAKQHAAEAHIRSRQDDSYP